MSIDPPSTAAGDATSTVRAVARVGAAAAGSTAPAALRARTRPGYLGTLSIVRLLVIEVLLIAVPIALLGPLWIVLTTAAVCGACLVLALGRRGNRWWTERFAMRRRFRQRRVPAGTGDGEPPLARLRALAPDLRVDEVTAPDGARIGLASDSAGWYAVATVSGATGMRGDAPPPVPLARLARLLGESGQPGAVLQVVTHTVPAPHAGLDPQQRCATSYRELLERYGAVPANRTTWVAVRIDARVLAEASLDRGDESAQAPAVVAGLIRKVSRTLDRVGLAAQVLDADGLLDALVLSCDLGPPPSSTTGQVPREEWASWHSSRLAHACYWVRCWPAAKRSGALLDELATAPAAFTSLALILEPSLDSGGTDLKCLVRLADEPSNVEAGGQALAEIARRFEATLLRLDGEHAPAVYASAPTGGGAR